MKAAVSSREQTIVDRQLIIETIRDVSSSESETSSVSLGVSVNWAGQFAPSVSVSASDSMQNSELVHFISGISGQDVKVVAETIKLKGAEIFGTEKLNIEGKVTTEDVEEIKESSSSHMGFSFDPIKGQGLTSINFGIGEKHDNGVVHSAIGSEATHEQTDKGGYTLSLLGNNVLVRGFKEAYNWLTEPTPTPANDVTHPVVPEWVDPDKIVEGEKPEEKSEEPKDKKPEEKSEEKNQKAEKEAKNTKTKTEHIVQPGDTLSEIAKKHGTTVEELKKLNPKITDPNKIFIGQTINLPGSTKYAPQKQVKNGQMTPIPLGYFESDPSMCMAAPDGVLDSIETAKQLIQNKAGVSLSEKMTASNELDQLKTDLANVDTNGKTMLKVAAEGMERFMDKYPWAGDAVMVVGLGIKMVIYSPAVALAGEAQGRVVGAIAGEAIGGVIIESAKAIKAHDPSLTDKQAVLLAGAALSAVGVIMDGKSIMKGMKSALNKIDLDGGFAYAGAGGGTGKFKVEVEMPKKGPEVSEFAAKNVPDSVNKVGKNYPRNAEFAGQQLDYDSIKDVKTKEMLKKDFPEGIHYNEKGHADFSPYAINTVKVEGMTGKHANDQPKADRKARQLDPNFIHPKGYTWHHHEDGITMQLVPEKLHNNIPHTGGAAVLRHQNKVKE